MHKDVITALAVESVHASIVKQAGMPKLPPGAASKLNPLPFLKGLFGGGAKAKVPVPKAPRAVPSAPTATAARAAGPTPTPAASVGSSSVGAAAAPTRSALSRAGRTAGAVGAVGTAAVGAGHYNNARNEAAMNPFESYRHHNDKLNQMTGPLDQQLANAGEDMDQYQALLAQRESGDFGASPWSFGGLNPWAEAGADSHMKAMRDRTSEASNQFTAATNQFGDKQKAINTQIAAIQKRLTQPGMLPQQKQFYQSQLTNLQTTLKGLGAESADAGRIRSQAQEAGMFEAGGQFPTPGGPSQLGAASAAPTPTPMPAPPASPVVPPTPPPNSNPLLTGGAQRLPLTPTNLRTAPLF